MGLVVALTALAIAGCYTPSLRDCVVTCGGVDDCAAGQTCTGGWCAAAGASCGTAVEPVIDAGAVDGEADAMALAADATMHDAAPTYSLRVTVMGVGEVVIAGVGTCVATGGPGPGGNGDCTYPVPAGAQITAVAQSTGMPGHDFDKWTDPICKLQNASCVFTPLPVTLISAQFK